MAMASLSWTDAAHAGPSWYTAAAGEIHFKEGEGEEAEVVVVVVVEEVTRDDKEEGGKLTEVGVRATACNNADARERGQDEACGRVLRVRVRGRMSSSPRRSSSQL